VSKLLSCVRKLHPAREITLCVWKSYYTCINQSCACWNHTCACANHIRACRNHTLECHIHTHTCQTHTLRVEITLMRVGITVVSVVITFVRVKITMRVKITLCVKESHSWVHAFLSKLLSCASKPQYACKITLSVWKSYSECRNQSCACLNHIRACRHHTLCRNYTLCEGITLERIEITLERVEITIVCVIFTGIRVKLTLVCVENTLCLWEVFLFVETSQPSGLKKMYK
jgi:hypothetical protein